MTKGTDSEEMTYLAVKAQWMMNGGRSEEDWNALPLSTIKLLTVDMFAREERDMDLMAGAIVKAFSPKKDRE